MNYRLLFLLTLCWLKPGIGKSQKSLNERQSPRGNFYFYWGWNRATYTRSDVHFKGTNFDFRVDNVKAKDRQSKLAADPYLRIDEITIPQYNFRMGYFFNNKYNFSIGADHMKYVMVQDQVANVTGDIHGTGTGYNGSYDNTPMTMAGDFLQLEHTDGLNYLNMELNRVDDIYIFNKNIVFTGTYGIGTGILYPRSRCVILANQVNDQWHLSGYGISAKAGINIKLLKHFFIQGELKTGFINMPNIVIEANSSDRAKQHFGFMQGNIVFGYQFALIK
ncbi:MAG: hypothetical protein V4613_06115 [Bacteroidota bacterium]